MVSSPHRFRLTIAPILILALAQGAAACKKPEPRTRGVGDALKSFIVEDCESRKQYCQVCAFSGQPILMAVADISDAAFEDDLARMQKLVDANAEKGLKAFAVFGAVRDGRLETVSPADHDKTIAQLAALKSRLGVTFPLTVLPNEMRSKELSQFAKFNDVYELKGSRMVLLADKESRVVFADVIRSADAERQFRSLEDALPKAL